MTAPGRPEDRVCRECGCTDDHACEGGCSWVEYDLCSRCTHGEVDYDVVMPFVAVTSAGGPFDDDAFMAGFRCGAIDAMLNLTREAFEAGEVLTDDVLQCRQPELAQLDLIAMRRGFTMDAEPVDDEWFAVTFTRAAEGDG